MWDIIRSLVAGGTTLLLTTQYLDEADELADEIVVIDHGLVIAAGTAEELKDRVGGDVVEFTVPDRGRLADAVAAVAPIGERRAARRRRDRRGQHRGRGARFGRAGRGGARLDGAGVETRGLALRRPSLDDVFLALTGHAAEEDDQPAQTPARPPRWPSYGQRRGEDGVMTAVAETVGAPGAHGEPSLRIRSGWAVSDTLTITRRNLLVWMRVPAYLVFTVIQPVMFVLLFRYVFGGAIPVQRGRLRQLPDARDHRADRGVRLLRHGHRAGAGAEEGRDRPAAVDADGPLGGAGRPAGRRHRADARDDPDHRRGGLRGRLPVPQRLRPRRRHGGARHRVRAGHLLHRRLHRAGHRRRGVGAGLRADLALPAHVPVSSAFVPIPTMPGWLQAFAKNQPVTYVINTMRALALGGPVAANLWKSAVWLAGIFVVFVPLAVRAYRRAA